MNFAHLFMVSLLPFATAWVARTQLAGPPMVLYAGIFVGVDIAYNVFEREVLRTAERVEVPERVQRLSRRRSLVVLAIFVFAMLLAYFVPRVAFALICCGLVLHLRPEVPGSRPRGR